MIAAQQWLNNHYPLLKRNNITELDIRRNQLTGSLNLESFPNLEVLECSSNHLTELNISDNFKLIGLYCSNNKISLLHVAKQNSIQFINLRANSLTDWDYQKLNPATLKVLWTDCQFNFDSFANFSNLINLNGRYSFSVLKGNIKEIDSEIIAREWEQAFFLLSEAKSVKVHELEKEIERITTEKEFIKVQRQDSLYNRLTADLATKVQTIAESNELIRTDVNIIRVRIPLQPEPDLINQLIRKLIDQQMPVEKRKELIDVTNDLIGIKQMFLNNRDNNIENLEKCCDVLESANQDIKLENTGKLLSIIGKVTESWLPIKVIEPSGELIVFIDHNNKRRLALKNSNLFQSLLAKEEKDLQTFEQTYQQITKDLLRENKKPTIFTNKYLIYEVVTNLWANKVQITIEDMKVALDHLQDNCKVLQNEVEQQIELLREQMIA